MKSGDHISRAPLGARSWLDSRVILFDSCVKITFFFVLLKKKPHNFPTAPTVKAIKVSIWTHRRSLRSSTVDGSTHCSTLLSSSAARSGSAARTVECAPRVTTKEKKEEKKKRNARSLSISFEETSFGDRKYVGFFQRSEDSVAVAPRAPAAACHIRSSGDGTADLQVAGEEPSMADVDAYLDVWLFIVSASSIFDDSNFVVTDVVLRNYRFCRDTFLSYNK